MSSFTSAAEVWDAIAADAAVESPLWAGALRPARERAEEAIFSALGEPRFALALETIYEGYLVHYGRPRLFDPADENVALLLGDYLYAHGLVRVAASGAVDAVADLAELISICAQLRADRLDGDGAAWAATAALLGGGELEPARAALRDEGDDALLLRAARDRCGAEAVDPALAAHVTHLG